MRILIVSILFASAVSLAAQSDASNGWVLKLTSTGGFLGKGYGTFILSSTGQLSCENVICDSPVPAELVQRLAKILTALESKDWLSQPPGTCRDCFHTKMELRREDTSETRTYVAEWDDASVGNVSNGMRELARQLTGTGRAQ